MYVRLLSPRSGKFNKNTRREKSPRTRSRTARTDTYYDKRCTSTLDYLLKRCSHGTPDIPVFPEICFSLVFYMSPPHSHTPGVTRIVTRRYFLYKACTEGDALRPVLRDPVLLINDNQHAHAQYLRADTVYVSPVCRAGTSVSAHGVLSQSLPVTLPIVACNIASAASAYDIPRV